MDETLSLVRFDSNIHSEVNVAGNVRAEGTEEAVAHETAADEVDASSDGLQQKSRDLARTGKGSAPGLGLREGPAGTPDPPCQSSAHCLHVTAHSSRCHTRGRALCLEMTRYLAAFIICE